MPPRTFLPGSARVLASRKSSSSPPTAKRLTSAPRSGTISATQSPSLSSTVSSSCRGGRVLAQSPRGFTGPLGQVLPTRQERFVGAARNTREGDVVQVGREDAGGS